jgi:hypothetical protein
MGNRGSRIPGRKQHLQIRFNPSRLGSHLGARHATGQDHVREEQINSELTLQQS